MKVSISLTDQNTKFVINNLYPLYLHDLSEVWGWRPNLYGVFETDDTLTLQDQNKVFDIWWEKPSILIPYLVTVEDIPAGFALVATPPYTPHGTADESNGQQQESAGLLEKDGRELCAGFVPGRNDGDIR